MSDRLREFVELNGSYGRCPRCGARIWQESCCAFECSAMAVMEELRARDIDVRVVWPELDERFFVYMFGRGVPPPKNRFRWCTSQIRTKRSMRGSWN